MDHAADRSATSHAAYRLFRLRRQIALTGALPLLGLAPAAAFSTPGSLFADPAWIFGATGFWVLAMAALASVATISSFTSGLFSPTQKCQATRSV